MAMMACPDAAESQPRRERGGYECEFVKPPPKQLQSECSICLLVLREPHIVSCCGQSFCETCIGRIQRDGKPCPLCNEQAFTTVANGGLKRTLGDFQVRCPHRELGCEWVGELGKLGQHLNSDPQLEHQLEGCQFTSIKCFHCKDHMRRQVIAGHQNERCPKRPYTCEHCEEYESTFEDVTNHWAECKCYLLPCPNNCELSRSGIERQNLEHHVKEECPLTVVECGFHYAGCGVKLLRKDMAVHMKEESVAHISLLAAENKRLAKQLLERDKKMQQLIQQNTELSHRINQQTKELVVRDKQLLEKNIQMQTNATHLQVTGEELARNHKDLEEHIRISSQELTRRLDNTICQYIFLLVVLMIVSIAIVAFAYDYRPSERAPQDQIQPAEVLSLKQELLQRASQELVELKQELLQKATQKLVELKQELSYEAVHELILLSQTLEQESKGEEVYKKHNSQEQKKAEEQKDQWSFFSWLNHFSKE